MKGGAVWRLLAIAPILVGCADPAEKPLNAQPAEGAELRAVSPSGSGRAAVPGSATKQIPERPSPTVSETAALGLLRALTERRAFPVSAHEATVGRFFRREDYKLIKGNPILGYWRVDGFRWTGDAIALDGLESAARACDGLTEEHWRPVIEVVAAKHGLAVRRDARIRLQGACVDAKILSSREDPGSGVELELKLTNAEGGQLLYRLRMGKPSIAEAMGAAIDQVVMFAKGRR